MLFTQAFAQATDAAAPAQPPAPGIMGFMPFILMFVVFYFLMIRPQQKKAKEQQNMLNELKKGEEVITQSGIFGKITGLTDKFVTLEVAANCRIKVLRSQIGSVIDPTSAN